LFLIRRTHRRVKTQLPRNIAILGPGLLGGSLLMALRHMLPDAHLRTWARRPPAVEEIAARKIADLASCDLQEVVREAGLIILCTPVETMVPLAQELVKSGVQPGCVVTDVGSVKTPVVVGIEATFANSPLHFVGSHPMAGSERAGLEAAREDLFLGAACIVTSTLLTAAPALQTVRALWTLLGCRVLEMSPEEHDRKVARISHLPRLVAAALTLAALQNDPTAAECMGNGFRDTAIRVASGDPDLWTGIVMQNRTEVLSAVRDARDRLHDLVAMLENVDDKSLHRFLHEAKVLRDRLG
jgi:prephenate dehydrogenase